LVALSERVDDAMHGIDVVDAGGLDEDGVGLRG
jgi:hypothetical protein